MLAHIHSRLDDEAGLRQVLVDDIKRAHRRKTLQPTRLPIGVAAIDGKTIWCDKKEAKRSVAGRTGRAPARFGA